MNSYYVDLLPIIKGKYRGVDRPWNMDNVYTNKSNAERLSLIQLFQRYDEIILLDDFARKIGGESKPAAAVPARRRPESKGV